MRLFAASQVLLALACTLQGCRQTEEPRSPSPGAPPEVGQLAPEIEGEDMDGVSFKLSDYRGKVVVLDFTGHWCPWCVKMYPDVVKLVERHAEEPFAFLAINTDDDREKANRINHRQGYNWRSWWDGGIGGPISTRWGVGGYPTLYVLDAKGVIRYAWEGYVPARVLNGAVDTLLREVADGGKRS